MSRSKRSSESQPEFFVDRCLGKGAPRELSQLGWKVHLISDYFPDDAMDVSDPEWIEFGITRGWSLLTQDVRIRKQETVRELLRSSSSCVHCLDTGKLLIAAKVARFEQHRSRVFHNVRLAKPGFYLVTATDVIKRWPSRLDR